MKHLRNLISYILFIFLLTGVTFAEDKLAFRYNILPDDAGDSSIDKKKGKVAFRLFENQGKVFFKGQELKIIDSRFDIDISELTGKQVFTFSNEANEEVSFTYYISDDNGLVRDFKLANTDSDVYVMTLDGVKVLYTAKEKANIATFTSLLKSVPAEMKSNLKEITLLPYDHSSKAAGITKYNKITYYNLFTYSNSQIKNIVFHEIAHTWAANLIKDKTMDYSYTNYSAAVKADNNFVSNYSKTSAQKGIYSEDFAESVAFYLMNQDNFTSRYSARANYIASLLK